MNSQVHTRVVRDLGNAPDGEPPDVLSEAHVSTIFGLVRVEFRDAGHSPGSVLLQPAAVKYLIAALAIECGKAEALAAGPNHPEWEC